MRFGRAAARTLDRAGQHQARDAEQQVDDVVQDRDLEEAEKLRLRLGDQTPSVS